MDFLTTAIYTHNGDNEEVLDGVLLIRYDEGETTKRPVPYYATAQELRAGIGKYGVITPRGFTLDDNGVLLSDTTCRSIFNDTVTTYIENEVPKSELIPLGLVDFVLDAIAADLSIFQNYDAMLKGEDTLSIMVAFSGMRVSQSSFNVYTPYRNSKNEFRTLSLVDITTDRSIPFHVVIPEGMSDICKKYQQYMVKCVPVDADLAEGSEVYLVDIPLRASYCYMGEAFVNYLAYNVAYYTMGEKVIDGFLKDTRFVPESEVAPLKLEEPRQAKKPLHNVRIEHEYRHAHLQQLMESMGNREAMVTLLSMYPEVNVTLDWVQTIFRNKPQDCGWDSDAMYQSCVRLKYSCRERLLRYSLEMLEQRFYVCSAGFLSDILPDIMKGGGVSGCSIKRATW